MLNSADIGAATRAQQVEDSNIGNCGRVWHVGFFFDGVGHDIMSDLSEHRLTNIARLYRAFPDKSKNISTDCYDAFYYPGMGRDYNYSPEDPEYYLKAIANEKMRDDVKELSNEYAKDKFGDFFIKRESWTDILWKIAEDLNNPIKWLAESLKKAGKIAWATGIESSMWIRDSRVMSEFFMTGEPTRIFAARKHFEDYYESNSKDNDIPIKKISVSLFGFDLGATLAREFLDKLLEDVCDKRNGKYWYKNSPLDITFTGFFDCSRHTPVSSNNGVDYFFKFLFKYPKWPISLMEYVTNFMGEKALEQNSALPNVVRNAMHLIAAHERRPWRGLYMLGNVKDKDKCMREELLLPGSSEDIGGGMLPDEQKPSAELCRVALYRMYDAATRAGVPLPDFETLDKTDPEIARYYLMDDAVKGNSANRWAKLYQSDVPAQIFSPEAQEKHLDNYFLWLGEQYYMYQCVLIQLNDELLKISSESVSGMFNVLTPEGREKVQFLHNKINELKTLWGWLDDVKSVAIGLKNDFIVSPRPNDSRMLLWANVYEPAVKRAVCFLDFFHRAYKGEPLPDKRVSVSANIIYSYFMHDIQKVEVNASITEDFFLRRSAEIPEAKSED